MDEELTAIQVSFLAAVISNRIIAVRDLLSGGHKDLLCILGRAASEAMKSRNSEILDLLLDEKSPYKIVRKHQAAVIAPSDYKIVEEKFALSAGR